MTPQGGLDWSSLGQYLGVALPLVVVLFYLLRQAEAERIRLTNAFIEKITEIGNRSIQSREAEVQALADITVTIARLTDAVGEVEDGLRESRAAALTEHEHIVEAIRAGSLETARALQEISARLHVLE